MFEELQGIYAASLTPMNDDYSVAPGDLIPLLDFLSSRGCHGALLFGTTGEGPSLSPSERVRLIHQAVDYKQNNPTFRILAGTGTPSLKETIDLTETAFKLGVDGVVVLPPYYYRNASEDGLFYWFDQLIQYAVPEGRALFGYHIPAVSGVELSLTLLSRLHEKYPRRFAGIKDSSGDPDHAANLGEQFGRELSIMTGNDRLLSHCLENSGAGSITALANLSSDDARKVWDSYQNGTSDPEAQRRLDNARSVLDRYPPAPPTLKALYARWYRFPRWTVIPPLQPLTEELEYSVAEEFEGLI